MKKCIAVIQLVLLGILMTATLTGAAETGCLLPADNWLVFVSSEGTGPFSFSIAVMDTNGSLVPASNIIALSAHGNPYVFETNANTADVSLACDAQDGTAYIFHDRAGELTLSIIQDIVPATAPTFSISGTITNGGLPLSGVTITLSGAATGTTTTNASGVYTFTGLANGSYTVTPSLAGFTFTPVNRAVVINNANVTGQNFTATAAATFTISGTVSTAGAGSGGGSPIAGATVSIAGKTTATDGSGAFTITGIPAGTYTLTISKTDYYTYTNPAYAISSNQTGLNFFLTPSASGDVALQSGVPSNGSVSSGQWKYYYIDVPSGATNLEIKITSLSSDVDLYTLFNVKPTLTSYTCRPYASGTVAETCTYTNPSPGRWWAGVYGYSAGSFTITATITTGTVGSSGVCYIDTACSAGNQYKARDNGSTLALPHLAVYRYTHEKPQ